MSDKSSIKNEKVSTHHLRCDFGKHDGELYTRIPVGYLLWMVQCGHRQADIAQAELDRRGTVTPKIEISGHAIDRASQRCLGVWQRTRKDDEGIHAWLSRSTPSKAIIRLHRRSSRKRNNEQGKQERP